MRRNVAAGKIRRSTSHTASMMISSPRLSVSIAVSKTLTNMRRPPIRVSPPRLDVVGGARFRCRTCSRSCLENHNADRGAEKERRQLILDNRHHGAIAEKEGD